MNYAQRSLSAVLAVLVLVLAMALPAAARAAETWLPIQEFDADRSVYLDPGLADHSSYPVSLSGLEAKLQAQSDAHGLKFYFIMTEQGTESNNSNMLFGAWKLEHLSASIASKLPADEYVLILLVRANSDPSKFSMAANGGNRLQEHGLTGRFFDNWLVFDDAQRIYLPNDPSGFANRLAEGVNTEVTESIARAARQEELRLQRLEAERLEAERIAEEARQAEIRRAEEERLAEIRRAEEARQAAIRRAELEKNARMYGPPAGFIFLGGLLLLIFRLRKSGLSKLLETWRGKITTSSDMYQRLIDGYFGFLKHQTEWEKRFTGTTAKRFKEAVTDFANYSARQVAANRRFLEADGLAEKLNFPWLLVLALIVAPVGLINLVPAAFWPGIALAVFGFGAVCFWQVTRINRVSRRLTVDPITLTGEELPLELATAYGGLVQQEDFAPDVVLKEIEVLFDRTNKNLAEIKNAFEGAAQNKKDIEALDATVTELKPDLEEVGLTFNPYQLRYDQLVAGLTAFAEELDEDPLDAFADSEEVEAGFESLKADMQRAIRIQKSFSQTTSAIASAKKRVAEVRGKQVGYAYPLADDEQRGLKEEATFTLEEKDANPDTITAKADTHFAKARKAVLEGRLDAASREKAAAELTANEAIALVADILAAKALIEKQVVPARTSLTTLRSDIPGAETAVTQLRAEFLPKNFTGQPKKLTDAVAVRDSTDAELAKIKRAYDEQRYLAARKLVLALGENLQVSIDRLVEIHARLKQLRELKQHARDTLARAAELANFLATKLEKNAFTTSQATLRAYKDQLPVLEDEQEEAAREITDWVIAAADADTVEAAFKAVDRSINEEKQQHNNARQALANLDTAIDRAEATVYDADTRDPARSRLAEVEEALESLRSEMRVARNNWASISRRAGDAKTGIAEAVRLAKADKKAANSARTAIRNASSTINSTPTSYSHGVTASLGSARSSLSQAKIALGNRNYERATKLARQAKSRAESAESTARSRVAAIVAEIRRKEAAERRRKQQEAAAAAARRRRRNRSTSIGSGGSPFRSSPTRSGGSPFRSSPTRSGGRGSF